MKQSDVSRSERRSMLLIQIALLLVVVIGAICFAFLKGEEKTEKVATETLRGKGDSGISQESKTQATREIESFTFDPNTADSATLRRLGLSDFQIRNIYRYRAAGGAYHRPEEFKKLYGLTVEQWHHLQPLIRIGDSFKYLADTPEAYDPSKDGYQRRGGNGYNDNNYHETDSSSRTRREGSLTTERARRDTTHFPIKLKVGQTIDINLADTNALKRIPGIGSYYARKIVEYRNKLGGFTSLSQLEELENIPMGIEAFMELNPTNIKKLRINHCTFRELNNHPYISYYQTRVICNHVRQFGPIHSFKDISLYEEFTEKDFQRLAPYVDFSE